MLLSSSTPNKNVTEVVSSTNLVRQVNYKSLLDVEHARSQYMKNMFEYEKSSRESLADAYHKQSEVLKETNDKLVAILDKYNAISKDYSASISSLKDKSKLIESLTAENYSLRDSLMKAQFNSSIFSSIRAGYLSFIPDSINNSFTETVLIVTVSILGIQFIKRVISNK